MKLSLYEAATERFRRPNKETRCRGQISSSKGLRVPPLAQNSSFFPTRGVNYLRPSDTFVRLLSWASLAPRSEAPLSEICVPLIKIDES